MMSLTKLNVWWAPVFVLLAFQNAHAQSYTPESLSWVKERVIELRATGGSPVVIFDLDDTLINTRDRNVRILRDFARQPSITATFPTEAAKAARVTIEKVHYLLKETLAELGIDTLGFVTQAEAFWHRTFFTSEYCQDDLPMRGAPAYVKQIVDAGGTVVYLTGRDRPRMHAGTEINLRQNGFPIDSPHAVLMMKDKAQGGDLDFKIGQFSEIRKLGTVVAGFENEPANINAFQEGFKDGLMIFIDSIHSPKPDVVNPGIFWVRDFAQ